MHYLQFFFRSRTQPVLVPVTEEEATDVHNSFHDRSKPFGFIETEGLLDQRLWVNGAHLQMVRFLFEPDTSPPFAPEIIGPSKQYLDRDEGPDYENISWHVTVWLREREKPVTVFDLTGGDWVQIYTSCMGPKESFVITDEDGEEVAIRVAEIDMLAGIEVDRYPNEHLDAVMNAIE